MFVANHPCCVSNTFTEAVMFNGAVGEREKATRYVGADFTHVRLEGAACSLCTAFFGARLNATRVPKLQLRKSSFKSSARVVNRSAKKG